MSDEHTVTFKYRTHPEEPSTRDCDCGPAYAETYEMTVDGRDRLWSVRVQEARDTLAEAIAEDMEERSC